MISQHTFCFDHSLSGAIIGLKEGGVESDCSLSFFS